jgi:1-aminocyclopropane-1-carboxylate deaminase
VELNKTMNLLAENIVNLSLADTQRLSLPVLINRDITLDVLRLDKIDPVISGNKWFKLKYYFEEALQQNQKRVLTFGGAWSNHIAATACAAKRTGMESIGIIRGEKPAILSHTLREAAARGMQLVFVSRELYNQKNNPAFIERLLQEYNNPCIIPQGGEGKTGIKGASEILNLTDAGYYTHILCAVGTGTMLSGIIAGSLPYQQIIGVPVLKGFDNWLPAGIDEQTKKRVRIETGYHMGGYAKKNNELFDFMNQFYNETKIPLDFVYTGKLFFSAIDLIKKNYFQNQVRLLTIHSGGLQSNESLQSGMLDF